MREIKFRAWDKSLEEMTDVICLNLRELADDHILISKSRPSSYNQLKENIVLMQYTGLKDIGGKEIYEGDVVETTIPTVTLSGKTIYQRHVITHRNASLGNVYGHGISGEDVVSGFILDGYSFDNGKCRVVGNIYENPELIKS